MLGGTIKACQAVGIKMGMLESGTIVLPRHSVAVLVFCLGTVVRLSRECFGIHLGIEFGMCSGLEASPKG